MRSDKACQVPKSSPRLAPIVWGFRFALQTGPKMSPQTCHWSILSTEHVVCYVVREPNTGPPPEKPILLLKLEATTPTRVSGITRRTTLSE